MYSEQLEALIKNVLADGVITDKERAVLHKKAEAEGVDVDEIDVYIDGELDKIRNEQMKAKVQVRKCPTCGELIPLLSNICPSCGSAIDNLHIDDLRDLIDTIENDLVAIKTISNSSFGKDTEKTFNEQRALFEKHLREARIYYGNNKKLQMLIDELNHEVNEVIIKYEKYIKSRKLIKISIIAFAILFISLIAWGIISLVLLYGIGTVAFCVGFFILIVIALIVR